MRQSLTHRSSWGRLGRCASAVLIALVASDVLLHGPAVVAADDAGITVDLNKLEPQDKLCRAYFVVDNPTDAALTALKLDLVMFRQDGVIDRRLTVNLAPLRPQKKSVKIFDLSDMSCQNIGSMLLNDVTECTGGSGAVADCADRLKVMSHAAVPFSK